MRPTSDDEDDDDSDFEENPISTELDRYLAAGREKVTNVIQWWKDRRDIYPHLSRMTIDYYCILGKGLSSTLILISHLHILVLQRPPSTLKGFSAVAALSSHTFEIASVCRVSAQSSVSDLGHALGLSKMKMLALSWSSTRSRTTTTIMKWQMDGTGLGIRRVPPTISAPQLLTHALSVL